MKSSNLIIFPIVDSVDIEERTRMMVEIRKKTLVNIEKAQEKQKMYYDEKHCKDKEMFKVISKHNFYAGFLITDFGLLF